MDEKKFFEYMDTKHAEIIEGIAKILELMDIKEVVTKFADHSEKTKQTNIYIKEAPETIGDYTIGKKGCNKCGGKITWDNYDKETHPYPDHVDEDGKLIDCPEYN